jgi:hypothetical protein
LKNFPPSKLDDDLNDNDDDITDEEDPESQESHGWLESGNPHPKSLSGNNGDGPSDYKGKQTSLGDPDNNPKEIDAFVSHSTTTDVIQNMHDLAVKLNPQIMMSQAYGCNQSPKWQPTNIILGCMKSPVKSSDPEHDMMSTGVSSVEVTNENSGMQLLPQLDSEQESKLMPVSEDVEGTVQDLVTHERILDLSTIEEVDGNGTCHSEEMLQSDKNMCEGDMVPKLNLSELIQTDLELVRQMNCLDNAGRDISVPMGPEHSKLPNFTRHSSRVQDKEMRVLDKATARKAGNKGTLSCSIPSTSSNKCPLDTIARACGFSLGLEEETRLANISLIQAKEDAMMILLKTKQKILSSSDIVKDEAPVESSVDHQNPALELAEANAVNEDNLSIRDQG